MIVLIRLFYFYSRIIDISQIRKGIFEVSWIFSKEVKKNVSEVLNIGRAHILEMAKKISKSIL